MALVAGSSSGIGSATARAIAGLGTSVALVGRRAEQLEQVAATIKADGGHALAVPADLSAAGACAEVVERVRDTCGPVELLVCSAATIRLGDIHTTELSSWERQLRLNLTVPFALARLVLPEMRARGRGWIVNIGSGVGSSVVPGSGAYGVSKYALHRLTELIHEENRDHGVRAYVVNPGWVDTRLAARPEALGVDPSELLQPEDIADTVAWLVTRPARVSVGPVVRVEAAASQADSATAMTRHVASSAP